MKNFYCFKPVNRGLLLLLFGLLGFAIHTNAQKATVSIPIGIGYPCTDGGNQYVEYFDYNSITNNLTHRSNCKPTLASPGFSAWLASISYNPYDGYIYFTQIANVGGTYNSYTYRWLPTTCPNLATLPVYQTFPNQFVAGVEFDPATGLGYQINLTGPGGAYNMELQQVNFATGVLGVSKPIDFGGRFITRQSGDVIMTPGGQMLAIFDNKYCTINWKDYASAAPLVATYINTLNFGGNSLVGLSYSDGKLVGSVVNGCSSTYKEIDILTGAESPISFNAGPSVFVSNDMADISSGIGAAKKLISATENPIGSKIYDIVYEVLIKNLGSTNITDVQGYDTLNQINGSGSVLSGSITSITGPSGITANPSYDGKTAGNFTLLNPGSTLSNIPGQNTITLQISCRIKDILPGVVYNNQAVVTGVGLLGDNLRDSSTNGSKPDLNSNDKPDDVGESQPTPLLISVVAQTPPCVSLTNILYAQDFGSGTGLSTTIAAANTGSGASTPTGVTFYSSSTTAPIPLETYTITNNTQNANTSDFIFLADHTGNANGGMMVVNADASNTMFYQGSFMATLCASQQYSLSFYAAFPGNSSYQTLCNAFGGFQYPKIKIRIRDGISGLIITQASTTSITANTWQQFGLKFISPASYTKIIIELENEAAGGCGNDVAIDDIRFGSCDPIPVVNVGAVSAGCMGSATTFTSSLNDPAAMPGSKDYQWQVSTTLAGPYSNIGGANAANFTISSIAGSDTGKYYRVVMAATGNIGTASCQYISPGVYLAGKISSVAPTAATKNKNNICPGISVTLGITGGTLGTNAAWKWYTTSCGGTAVGTGATIAVTPAVTTTYYVRAEGDCNNTTCQQVTVFISCDIDKDKDGIPDYVESNMPVALQDANSDGIINALDATYPGFVDNNNDFINDNFQADGDSDNDGIPNYLDTDFAGRTDSNGDGVDDQFDMDKDGKINMLDKDSDNDGIPDVVEAYGVDANGDGKIDNYTDTDNDGLSQNVDGNSTGVPGSGLGLGFADLDGDGVPNYLDLDSDNDGIPDVVEAGGTDANNNGMIDGFTDTDGDGFSDNVDGDVGNDGVAENAANALLRTGPDTSPVNGRADNYPYKNMDNDGRANPYDCDSDGDGIVDVRESGLPYTDTDGWIDGVIGANGWSTSVSSLPALNLRNTDTRGNPDYLDIDADDDGIPDNIEGLATNSYLLPKYLDNDNDGLDNSYDDRPLAFGGGGILFYDNDGDGIPDYLDSDSDADGVPDIIEGNDFNRNGYSDDNVTLTYQDTDGDGLDNRFDSLNSVINVKGTSYNMGNGGSTSGDVGPGSRSPVQKSIPSASDRDWRSAGVVLPVKLFTLAGNMQKNTAYLTWKVITTEPVDHFEIERSVNTTSYATIAAVHEEVKLYETQSYAYTDNMYGIVADQIMYRIKILLKSSRTQYSNIVSMHPGPLKRTITIAPNPVAEYVNVKFSAQKDAVVNIRLLDNSGKTVLLQKQVVTQGLNVVRLINLNNFAEGVYTVQMVLDGEMITEKLLLLK